MTSTAKALCALFVVALITHIWMYRFEVKASGNVGAFIHDRWTGAVEALVLGQKGSDVGDHHVALRIPFEKGTKI
jgi:hypothetical protein